MKKALFTLITLAGAGFIMMGADFTKPDELKVSPKKFCVGYTIIEAGKGIDCNGDTLSLIKEHGFYEVASRYEKHQLNETIN